MSNSINLSRPGDSMKKSTPPQIKHRHCPSKIVRAKAGPHYAQLVCIEHKVIIQWLSQKDCEYLEDHGYIIHDLDIQT